MGLLPDTAELSPRPDWVPAWASLPPEEQRLYARFQECFAAYLSYTDHQIGRVLGFLEELGQLDNTLVFVLSDNGASSEGGVTGSINDARPWNMVDRPVEEAIARIDELGGPLLHNNYPWGWTVAGNTPFRRWKREVHEGGVADPLVMSWPARHRRPRRGAPPVRARDRPRADDLGADRRGPARRDRRRDAERARRRELRALPRPRRRRDAPRDPVLRDARLPGHLPPRLEGGDLPHHLRPERELRRRRVGAVPRRRGRVGVSRRGGRTPRAPARARRTVVDRGGAPPRPSPRQRALRPRLRCRPGGPRGT